jgi:hypothetical protein
LSGSRSARKLTERCASFPEGRTDEVLRRERRILIIANRTAATPTPLDQCRYDPLTRSQWDDEAGSTITAASFRSHRRSSLPLSANPVEVG